LQSHDYAHTLSETDVTCREMRRLAGVPYITRLDPATRAAGGFRLVAHGGNFTPQTVLSWNGTRLPTTVSGTQLSASVGNELIPEPSEDVLLPGELFSPPSPVPVSVNNYDADGNLIDDFYAGQANCKIGVVIEENPVTVIPAAPTAEDPIIARLTADWNTGCVPQDPQLAISGNQITVTATNPFEFCTLAFAPYELEASFGPLPAGDYEVVFRDVRPPSGSSTTTRLGSRTFSVINPTPVLSLLQPDSISAGSSGFTLRVEGEKFQPANSSEGSSVYWNGTPRPTTFVGSGELQASISAADVAEPGTAMITVRTGDALISEPLAFTITEPLPTITSLAPGAVVEGSPPVELQVVGMRFAPAAAVLWTNSDGMTMPLQTIFVSSTELEATVPSALIATPGSYPIAVVSNGATSAAEYFVVGAAEGGSGTRPIIGAATNAASFEAGVSPGGMATLFGENLANATEQADTIPLPTNLAGTQVLVAGLSAPLYYVSPGQINFQVPFEAPVGETVSVQVIREDQPGTESSMLIADYALGVFFYDREPQVRDPIITHADGSLLTPASPASPGEVVIVWATGVGKLENPPPTGAASRAEPLAHSKLLPQVILGGSGSGSLATAQFVGLTPGYVGLIQIHIELPAARPAGPVKLGIRFDVEDEFLLLPIPVVEN
jgi:uncharacterized protein (TIGR03437 family)